MSARSRIATRRAAAELAGHRRRLLECGVEPDLDPADAMLLRVGPPGARIADAALAVGAEDSHLTQPKSPATDSRPPVSEIRPSAEADLDPASFFTPTVNKTSPLNSASSACRTGRGAGESATRIDGRVGEGATPSSHHTGLARLVEAALAVGEKSDHNPLKAAAADSRPPALTVGHNGTPATDGIQAPAAARPATDLRLALSPSGSFAGREGEGQAPSNPTTASDLSRWGEGEISTPTKEN